MSPGALAKVEKMFASGTIEDASSSFTSSLRSPGGIGAMRGAFGGSGTELRLGDTVFTGACSCTLWRTDQTAWNYDQGTTPD
jgi:alpha-D-ribose 1-methylphosphonate 5-triphosphate synthase subunit PhnG